MRRISEEMTRKEMIDPQLEHVGWYLRDHSKVKTEIPVDGIELVLGEPQVAHQVLAACNPECLDGLACILEPGCHVRTPFLHSRGR